MARSVLIHLPDDDGHLFGVLVKSNKRYGKRLGSELIKLYKKRPRNKPLQSGV